MHQLMIALALVLLTTAQWLAAVAPAQAVTIYKEDFDNGLLPPQGWTLNPNPAQGANADSRWGLFDSKDVCGDKKRKKSFAHEKYLTNLPIGSTPIVRYEIAMTPFGIGGNETTIKMSASSCYNNNGSPPSIGNNYFCWALTGSSEFRICLEQPGNGLSATVGGSDGFSFGNAAAYDRKWVTLTAYYTLGKSTALAIVDDGAAPMAKTVNLFIMQPDPMNHFNWIKQPYALTSVTGSNIHTSMNFTTPQTGAIYIDDLRLDFLRTNPVCGELNALSSLGTAVQDAKSAAGC